MACCTVVIFSASSSGISVSNSSSRAITSSTVSSESAPRSSTNEDVLLISASFTPSCSATIFLTRCSTFSIADSFPLVLLRSNFGGAHCSRIAFLSGKPLGLPSVHVHAAVHVKGRAGDIGCLRRIEKRHHGRHILRISQPPRANLLQQR